MDVLISDSASSSYSASAASIGFAPAPAPLAAAAAPAASTSGGASLAQPPAPSLASSDPSPAYDGSQPTKTLAADSKFGATAAKIFHSPQPLNVEFHSANHEIVTILRDPQSGQVYAEFPADAVVQIAEFFQHLAGFVVDHKA